jgi:signal peptidase I
VPPGDYFVLGDHRGNSDDSHMWTTTWLPRRDIIGKAWVSYWPPPDAHLFVRLPAIHLGW